MKTLVIVAVSAIVIGMSGWIMANQFRLLVKLGVVSSEINAIAGQVNANLSSLAKSLNATEDHNDSDRSR